MNTRADFRGPHKCLPDLPTFDNQVTPYQSIRDHLQLIEERAHGGWRRAQIKGWSCIKIGSIE